MNMSLVLSEHQQKCKFCAGTTSCSGAVTFSSSCHREVAEQPAETPAHFLKALNAGAHMSGFCGGFYFVFDCLKIYILFQLNTNLQNDFQTFVERFHLCVCKDVEFIFRC